MAGAAGIGIPASDISVRYRSIHVPDYGHSFSLWYRTDRMPDSPVHSAFTKIGHKRKGVHTARLPCQQWRATYIVYTLHVHIADGREGYNLHVHTTGLVQMDTPCQPILLEVESRTPCKSILFVLKRHPASPYWQSGIGIFIGSQLRQSGFCLLKGGGGRGVLF